MRQLPTWLLVVSALGLGLLARLVLEGWTAAGAYALAAALFAQASGTPRTGAPTLYANLTGLLAGYGLVVAAVVAVFVKRAEPPQALHGWGAILFAWLTAVAAYSLAWASPRSAARSLARAWKAHRLEICAASAVILAALFLRTAALDRFPRVLGHDDDSAALRAREVIEGRISSPFGVATIGLGQFPSLYFFAQAGVMRVFGDDVAGARMFSALLGTSTVAGLYLLGRAWFGYRVGLTAAALLATLPFHVFWSRNPGPQLGDALTIVFVLLLASRALSSGRSLDYALAGLSLGLGQYAYQGVRLLYGVLLVLVLREAIVQRGWLTRNRSNLLIMVGGLVVAYLPQAVFFLDHPQDYTGRFNQVSIIHSGWLANEVRNTGRSTIEIVAEQMRRAFLVFNAVPPRSFFETGRPVLDPFSGALLIFGAALALVNLRQRSYCALLITLVTFLLGVALTDNVPNAARLAGTAPLAALLVALGLVGCADAVSGSRRWLTTLAVVAATVFIGTLGIHFYFFQWANASNYDQIDGATATELAYYMRRFAPGTRFVFLGRPPIDCKVRESIEFIAPRQVCLDGPRPGAAEPLPALGPTDVVVALEERRAEAERLVASRGAVYPEELRVDGKFPVALVAFRPSGGSE